ncbi:MULTISPECIES: hypothetical protein [unclassified Microcoleus]|uniref:hypothetical protein n=1 Tax=unclassified Microcoleus TaxID=2642155 RepID=UPI002FD1D0FC
MLTICRIAGFYRITLTRVGRSGKFCKVFIKYCWAVGGWATGVEGSWGVEGDRIMIKIEA